MASFLRAFWWLQVSDECFGAKLLEVVRGDEDYQARRGKTLIFAADGAATERISELLSGGHVPHLVYHKNRSKLEQTSALQTLRQEDGTVMLCTDAAARGLDVQGITHVVQVNGEGMVCSRGLCCQRIALACLPCEGAHAN